MKALCHAVYFMLRIFCKNKPKKGNKWQFDFKPTYIIGILEFELIKDSSKEVVRSVRLIDETTQKVIYPNLTFIYVELPKFTKVIDQLETDLDLWLFQFKHLSQLKAKPKALNWGVFQKLMIVAEMARMTTEERIEYMGRIGAEWKEYTTRKTQIKIGLQQGLEKGIAQGKAEGEAQKEEEMIVNILKKRQLSTVEIAKLVDLGVEKVKAIKTKNNL